VTWILACSQSANVRWASIGTPRRGCLAARFPAATTRNSPRERFHLLLEDLSETHSIITLWPLPPSDEACERIIDTWASFHAFWWRHSSLGREVGTFLDEAALATITAEYRERYTRFARTLDDRLWPAARAIYHECTSRESV